MTTLTADIANSLDIASSIVSDLSTFAEFLGPVGAAVGAVGKIVGFIMSIFGVQQHDPDVLKC